MLKNHLHASFDSQVWRLLVDDIKPYLMVEIRDANLHKVGFSVLDFEKGAFLQAPVLTDEWWLGLEEIHNGIYYLHRYLRGESPEHKGIIAFDALSNTMLWESKDLSYYKTCDSHIIAYLSEELPRKYLLINSITGFIESKSDTLDPWINEINVIQNKKIKRVLFPVLLQETSHLDMFSLLSDLVLHEMGKKPVKMMEYFEKTPILIFSFYTQENAKMTNFIWVLDNKYTLLFEKKLATDISSFALDTFFVVENQLFFISENSKCIESYFIE